MVWIARNEQVAYAYRQGSVGKELAVQWWPPSCHIAVLNTHNLSKKAKEEAVLNSDLTIQVIHTFLVFKSCFCETN